MSMQRNPDRFYKKVYIASPYTLGDVAVNVRRQMVIADQLITLGFVPFVPLYAHFQHMFLPRPYEEWLEIDKEWLVVCNCVLRLDGKSKGADVGVALATDKNIPVFFSVDELLENDRKLTI